MEVSGTDLRLVHSLAAGVTNRPLESFPGFMRLLRVLFVVPLWLLFAPAVSADDTTPTPTPPSSPSPSPSPSPLPTPVNAFLSLDVTAGPPSTVIEVSGGQFLPNQQTNLYWDTPSKVAGAATADANGSFNTRVKPNANDKPGVHKLCASVLPNPCANFALQAATPTPSPSPTPEESPSPSPEASPTPTLIATPARTNSTTINGFDVITRPPFVFLPIFGAGALLLSLAYWAFVTLRRPRKLAPMPAAAVVHRATRPDYAASFGTPPPRPVEATQPSAWDEATPAAPPLPATSRNIIRTPTPIASSPQPEPQTGTYHAWGLGDPDTGYPDLSAAEGARQDIPEPPQPSD